MIPLNSKLRLPPGHFGLLLALNQQELQGIKVLVGVTDPKFQGKIGLLFYNGGKEEYVWNTVDS